MLLAVTLIWGSPHLRRSLEVFEGKFPPDVGGPLICLSSRSYANEPISPVFPLFRAGRCNFRSPGCESLPLVMQKENAAMQVSMTARAKGGFYDLGRESTAFCRSHRAFELALRDADTVFCLTVRYLPMNHCAASKYRVSTS